MSKRLWQPLAKKDKIRAFIRVAKFLTCSTLGAAGNHKELKSLSEHMATHVALPRLSQLND